LTEPADFDSPVGKGVVGEVEGRAVIVGSAAFLQERGIDAAVLDAEAERHRAEGASVIFAALDGRLAGLFAIADPIKGSSRAAVEALHAAGVRLMMLTGDNAVTARAIAVRLGIDEVQAEVSPADKAAAVERLRREGRVVAMAGDGVNDAPALAAA